MDRFIDYAYGIDKDVETGLKSNMDRFIVQLYRCNQLQYKSLKSNMDRFIGVCVPFLSHPFTV